MWSELFLASVWGGVVAMDTTAAFQAMISRPMVSCTVVGLMLGNVPLGLTIGVLLELLYINELPVGAAKFSESNVGAVAAATVAIFVHQQLPQREIAAIALSLFLGIIISYLGGKLVVLMRRINSRIYSKLLDTDPLTPWHIDLAQFWGILLSFVLGFASVFLTAWVFTNRMIWALHQFPQTYDKILQPAMAGLLGAGCAFLAYMFWEQSKRGWLLTLGLAIGLVLYILS